MSESLVGQMIGNVRLEGVLGEGAVGSVYRGHHTTLGIDVAVKILKLERHQVNDTYYYERFRREAQITAKLNHPNLVKVRDFGQYNSLPYIIMEYVDGCAMDEYLRQRKGPLPEQTILKVLLSVASALSVAHAAGVIHRDLKPANILISQKGQLKVADLGLARSQDMPALTMEQMMVGSPGYMSPERLIAGGQVDHRSDIYALGVIGYQVAFGTMPYNGDIVQVIHGHLSGQASFDLPTHCGPETVKLIKKMMAYDQNDRHQNTNQVIAHIRAILTGKSVEVSTDSIPTSSAPTMVKNETNDTVAATTVTGRAASKAAMNGTASSVRHPKPRRLRPLGIMACTPDTSQPTGPKASVATPAVASTAPASSGSLRFVWLLGIGVFLVAVAVGWYFSR